MEDEENCGFTRTGEAFWWPNSEPFPKQRNGWKYTMVARVNCITIRTVSWYASRKVRCSTLVAEVGSMSQAETAVG